MRTEVTLGERVAKLYLDHRAGWRLRPLDGTTSAPLLHADGSVRVAEGYDEATRLWCERVPAITLPAMPTRADAEAALQRVRLHFRSLPFADAERVSLPDLPVPVVDVMQPAGNDESAFLVGLLTAICRPCLPLAPAVMIRAPQYSGSGTGKGLAVRCIAAVAFGIRPTALTAGGTPEEFEKRVSSALMEAGPVLFLDNMNGRALKSEVLASAITERPAAVRLLGTNTMIRLNPTAFIAITGNGLALSEDLARRFLTVDFDAGVEDPETRDFQGDLFAETLGSRPALLRDLLTLWRWGCQAGDTLPAGKALGSFSLWGRWCRDPLLALGCADPAVRVAATKAQDPRRQHIAAFFEAWWSAHADAPVAIAALAEAVRDAAGQAGQSRQAMAAKVRSLVGTRASGFVLTLEPTQGRWSADRYVLRQVPEETKAQAAPPMTPMTPMPSDHEAERRATDPLRDGLLKGWGDHSQQADQQR